MNGVSQDRGVYRFLAALMLLQVILFALLWTAVATVGVLNSLALRRRALAAGKPVPNADEDNIWLGVGGSLSDADGTGSPLGTPVLKPVRVSRVACGVEASSSPRWYSCEGGMGCTRLTCPQARPCMGVGHAVVVNPPPHPTNTRTPNQLPGPRRCPCVPQADAPGGSPPMLRRDSMLSVHSLRAVDRLLGAEAVPAPYNDGSARLLSNEGGSSRAAGGLRGLLTRVNSRSESSAGAWWKSPSKVRPPPPPPPHTHTPPPPPPPHITVTVAVT